MNSKRVLIIFGTRPEAIKVAPLIKAIEKHPDFTAISCVTAQHREMLDQVLDFYKIQPDYDLNVMTPNQSLYTLTATLIKGLEGPIQETAPDYVVVQGDTTTAMAGALAASYAKIPVIHLEAGLRSGDKQSPFPEELNRILAGQLSSIHFCPTEKAKENLEKEGIVEQVHVVGNTVIDALFMSLERIRKQNEQEFNAYFQNLGVDFSKKLILVTGHRRESFGQPFENICKAIRHIAEQYPDSVQFVYPLHLNPKVKEPVTKALSGLGNSLLLPPLAYPEFLWLMNKSYCILTDSGGIQEEAPSLGKPILVMREVTERQEGIDAGTATLVGTDTETIVHRLQSLIDNDQAYAKMANAQNPYGDGKASEKILQILSERKEITHV